MLRLSPDVYSGRSLAAAGVAAHEVGHAIQDARGYSLMSMRNAVVPMANIGSSLSWIFIMVGIGLIDRRSAGRWRSSAAPCSRWW